MFENKPWISHYAPGVPADVDIPDRTVADLLADAAVRWPSRDAVDFLSATLTYADLADEVARGAAVLRSLGVQPGDRVSLVLPNCTTHVVAFHAVLRLGAIAVEHNPTYTVAELREQFALTGSTHAIVWRNRVSDVRDAAGSDLRTVIRVDVDHDLPRLARLALRLPVAAARRTRTALASGDPGDAPVWHELLADAVPETARPVARPDDTALLLFTGGTTGVPKCAEITHRNLVTNATQGAAWAQFTPGAETVFGMLPFFHAFGMIFCLVLPPLIGATTVAFPNFDPAAVMKAQRRRPATFVPGVAPMFPRLLDAAGTSTSLTTIRVAFSGAMPLDPEVSRRWETATGGLLIEGYGMSECSPIALGNPCTADRRPGTLGLPFPNTDIRLINPGDPTGPGPLPDESGTVEGELLVRGPQVFRGYWNDPTETAHVLRDGWLRTGDIVRVDAVGHATMEDRVKEMINVGGFKVFPSQVEAHLREMPGVADVAVVGIPRDSNAGGESVVAVIVPEGSDPPELEHVREFASRKLPPYAIPRRICVVEALPVSMIGKIQRRVVRENIVATDSSHSG
ncbi:AMP-binding protein [Gordonia sp. NPDC003425]